MAEVLVETNRRLNRRCQELEAALADARRILRLPPDGDGVRWVRGTMGRALLAWAAKVHQEAVVDVADCGAEDIDPRLDYITVQVDRELWRRVRALAGKAAATDG